MLKRCSLCSGEAELSMVCVLSSIGIAPRRQKCSAAVLFCHKCVPRRLRDGGHLFTDDVQKSVNDAYTHVNSPSAVGADPNDA